MMDVESRPGTVGHLCGSVSRDALSSLVSKVGPRRRRPGQVAAGPWSSLFGTHLSGTIAPVDGNEFEGLSRFARLHCAAGGGNHAAPSAHPSPRSTASPRCLRSQSPTLGTSGTADNVSRYNKRCGHWPKAIHSTVKILGQLPVVVSANPSVVVLEAVTEALMSRFSSTPCVTLVKWAITIGGRVNGLVVP